MNTAVNIRAAGPADLPAITDIYNEAVKATTATFDTEPRSEADQLAWFSSHTGRYSLVVAEMGGLVVGWASITRWSERKAYDETGEVSFYVSSEHRGQGIGRSLTGAIVEEARKKNFHTLIARVAGESTVSLHLSRSFGFEEIGVMKEVGRKFGKLLDVHILQKML